MLCSRSVLLVWVSRSEKEKIVNVGETHINMKIGKFLKLKINICLGHLEMEIF